MIKVEVTEGFTLKDFGLLKNIVRKKVDKEGEFHYSRGILKSSLGMFYEELFK